MRVALSITSVVLLALLAGGAASPRTLPIRQPQQAQRPSERESAQMLQLARKVGASRVTTWGCQDTLGVKRSRASVSVWALPRSLAYRGWVLERWHGRAVSCSKALKLRTLPATNDWVTAVNIVQRVYPGTSGWLLYISDREGGHGGFVMNHQGSGAGGWMQYMASTYYGYSDAAFADARRRGFIVDDSWNDWHHPMGQAITAGYMRYTGRDGCHWCL